MPDGWPSSVCMGGNSAVHAAADDPLIRAVAAVTPHFRNAEADALWLGSQPAVAARLAAAGKRKPSTSPPARSSTYPVWTQFAWTLACPAY